MEVFVSNTGLNSEMAVGNLLSNTKNLEETSMKDLSKVRDSRDDSSHSFQKIWFNEVTEQ